MCRLAGSEDLYFDWLARMFPCSLVYLGYTFPHLFVPRIKCQVILPFLKEWMDQESFDDEKVLGNEIRQFAGKGPERFRAGRSCILCRVRD